MKKLAFLLFIALGIWAMEGRVMRFPDISHGKIVFSYGGDLWIVSEDGGVARRLTAHPGLEIFPRFSPDGKWIAFTGQYEGHFEVYVIPSKGGEPRRLTYFGEIKTPERFGPDNLVIDWTPDGKYILFRSRYGTFDTWLGKLYLVGLDGTPPKPLPLPYGGLASFSPDGKKIAMNRIFRDFRTWKKYKGGMAQDIWIYDLKTLGLKRITKYQGSDRFPMWIENRIFFASDREGWRLNLYSYDLKTGKISQLTHFKDYDVMWPAYGDGKIVFEKGGKLFLYNLSSGQVEEVKVEIPTDRLWARSHWVSLKDKVEDFDISPHGKRLVVVARGDIFTVPAKEGDVLSLTASSASRERYATWSPDGKWIAFVSDMDGEDEIYIMRKDGGKPVKVASGKGFKYTLVWSPDSKKIAWSDKNLSLWYVDIEEKKPHLVDRAKVWEIRGYAWSPDSKWIAYAKPEDNQLSSIFLYSLEEGKTYRVTSKMTDDRSPAFDPKGRYLFFISSRDYHPTLGHFELSYTYNKMDRIYAVLLRPDVKNPMEPRDDVEKEEKKEEKAQEKFSIEIKGLPKRVVAFKMKPGNYYGVLSNGDKVFFLSSDKGSSLMAYSLKERKAYVVVKGARSYALSADGKKIAYRAGATLGIIDANSKGKSPGEGKVNLEDLKAKVNPLEEWREIFMEVWRLERDFFYLPNMNGVDWKGMIKRWGSLIPYISHRFDLNYIIGEMQSELGTSHAYVGGGDYPEFEKTNMGYLGVDLAKGKNGYYRIARILEGANWESKYRSPLREPGLKVKEGDYLIAIEGREVKWPHSVGEFLEERAGKLTRLLINSKPSREGAWEIKVVPIANEMPLRYYNWVLNNRRKVEKLSGGKIGYLHIPDMSLEGLNEFVKAYYAQFDKQAIIIDVRFNGGGFVSGMILERLRRVVAAMAAPRNAAPETYPAAAYHGYLACLVNHYSASDGDIFPYFFKYYKLGPVIGTRSWGGVVGIRGYRRLLDGGYITTPEFGHYGLSGKWIIENHGVDPDIVVDNPPGELMRGKDPQLETAVKLLLEKIKKAPPKLPPKPYEKAKN